MLMINFSKDIYELLRTLAIRENNTLININYNKDPEDDAQYKLQTGNNAGLLLTVTARKARLITKSKS